MQKLVMVFVLLGVINRGLGEEPATAPAESGHSKIEHLLKAAEHLEAAGLMDEAREFRKRADQERIPSANSQTPPADNAQPPVLLQVRVMEISRAELQKLGFDSSRILGAAQPQPLVLGTAQPQPLANLLAALRKDGLARVLAEPTVVTLSNRPASFQSGGQSRVAVPQGGGRWRIEEKFYGTRVDFVPFVSDDQAIHLTCRIEVSNLDVANSVTVAGETAPVLDVLRVDTKGDYKSGQTVVLGGLITRRDSSTPAASDVAVAAAPTVDTKPKAKKVVEEIETLVLLTPEIVDPMPSKSAARTQTHR